jgi:hypothetical protein
LLPHQEARRDHEPSMQKGLISAIFQAPREFFDGPGTPKFESRGECVGPYGKLLVP